MECRAPQAEEAVPRLHADAGGGTPGSHATDLQDVALLRDGEAEEAPGEVVGMGGGEGREPHLVVLLATVAPQRERRTLALAVGVDALVELLARMDVVPVDADD